MGNVFDPKSIETALQGQDSVLSEPDYKRFFIKTNILSIITV
jgi:hypothetical protein